MIVKVTCRRLLVAALVGSVLAAGFAAFAAHPANDVDDAASVADDPAAGKTQKQIPESVKELVGATSSVLVVSHGEMIQRLILPRHFAGILPPALDAVRLQV